MNKAILGVLVFLLIACKDKESKTEEEATFFPIKSYLLSQAAQIDTSVYAIRKITTVNSKSDTVYIRREDFRTVAKDFLELPDISAKKWKQDYQETKQFVENSTVLFSLIPLKMQMMQRSEGRKSLFNQPQLKPTR
jgi:hypothetical protein